MTVEAPFTEVELNPWKLVIHVDKLEAIAAGSDVFPVTVEVDLVDHCNHQCGWCVDPYHGKHTADDGFVSALLAELRALGVEGIVFKGGGEPMLHGSFGEMLRQAEAHGFEVGIVTNGSRLSRWQDVMVECASYIRVSIDGPTPDSHRQIHRSDDFPRIVEGVADMVRAKRALGQRHPIVGLSFAMDYPMLDLVGEAIGLGDRLGVEYILLRPPFFEEVGRENTMSIGQKKELFAAFERARAAYKGNLKILVDYWISDSEAGEFSSREESPRREKYMQQGANGIEHVTGRCLASPLLAVVTADRNVYPCCNLRLLPEWSVGTVDYEQGETFEKAWRGERRQAVTSRTRAIECISVCTHPMSRYNEVIEYLCGPRYHKGFV